MKTRTMQDIVRFFNSRLHQFSIDKFKRTFKPKNFINITKYCRCINERAYAFENTNANFDFD